MSLGVPRSSSQKEEKELHVQKRADFYQTRTIWTNSEQSHLCQPRQMASLKVFDDQQCTLETISIEKAY